MKFIYFDYLHLTIAARLLVICLCLLLSNFVSDKLDIENWFNAGPFAMFIMSILWMLVLTYITDIVTGWIYKGIGFAGSEQIIPRIKEYKKERNIFKWTKQIAGRAE